MKRLTIVVSVLLVLFVLMGCEKKAKSITIQDIELNVGEIKEIDVTVEPSDAKVKLRYEFEGTNISIANGQVKGIVGGTETEVTAKTTNGLSTTFTVTVKPKELSDDESPEDPAPKPEGLKNGGFESGELSPWVVSDENYGLEQSMNDAYNGEYSFKLWYDADGDNQSEAFDITLHQSVTLEAGTYVFSAWLNTGSRETILWVKSDLDGDAIEELTIPGSTKGYKQYGIEFEVDALGEFYVGATFKGDTGAWGFADEFNLEKDGQLPSMDDLNPVDDSENLICNSSFEASNSEAICWDISNDTDGIVEINPNESNSYSGYHNLSMYNIRSGEIHIKQTVENLSVSEATLSVKIIGENFEIEEFYLYLKTGESIYKQDIRTTGWDAGFIEVNIDSITIEGDEVEVGIYFKQSEHLSGIYWANIDDFKLIGISSH